MERAKTSAEAKAVREKAEKDLEAAAGAAVRLTRLFLKLTVEPKIELAKKVIRALANEE